MKTQANQNEDFRLLTKKDKENVNPQATFSRSIEDKLQLMQRQVSKDASINDQYLLSSMETKKNQLTSVSFNLQSTDQHVDEYMSKPSTEQKNRYASKQRSPPRNDNAVFQVLLMELERRFDTIDDRIDKKQLTHYIPSEKLTRQANQTAIYTQEMLNQYQDRLVQLAQRISKVEHQVRVLEECFCDHRGQSELKFAEFNKHIDQALKSFITSSQTIAKKIDKLTEEQRNSVSGDSVQNEIDTIKAKLETIGKNLTFTHETLSDQIHDISVMQKSIENISSIDQEMAHFAQEIGLLKQRQIETLHYLQTLQENISTPSF